MADILIAEDDPGIRTAVALTLKCEGHSVRLAANGEEALARYAERRPDLLLLDVMMPRKSGWDVCEEIRAKDAALPVIMLTARGEESDKVLGLGLGADDYVTKPFGIRELVARVSAALRRAACAGGGGGGGGGAAAAATAPADPAAGEPFRIGSCTVDPARLALRRASGEEEPLSVREIGVLRLLAERPDAVVSRERFFREVWGTGYGGSTRTLDQHVAQVRRKLGDDAERVETVRGVGYRYRPPQAAR